MSGATGGCLCGKLRFLVQSPPARVTVCHCRFCQRATGGAYLVEPIFESSDFSVTKGEPRVYQHLSEGSRKQVFVHFCEVCGTKIFLSFERFPDVIGVYGGTFDDPDWYERTSENTRHIFLSDAQKGTVIPAGVNTFLEHASSLSGVPAEPRIFLDPKVIGLEVDGPQ